MKISEIIMETIMPKTIVLIAILMFFSSILIAQQEPVKGLTVNENVNVYSAPKINAELVSTYGKNIVVYIMQSYRNWYKININGKIGWIQKENIIIPITDDLKVFHGKTEKLIDIKDNQQPEISNSPKREETQPIYYSEKNTTRVTQWGIVFGLNLTQYSSSKKTLFESNTTHYYAGVMLLHNLNPYITFNSGLFYSVKGVEFDNNSDIIDFNIRYLEIPLSLKYTFSGIQNSSFYMSFGPYLDFYISNSLDLINEYLSNNITATDTGLHYGFGYQIALNGNSKLFFETNYFLGTNSIFQENITEKIYNYNFNFSLGLIF